MSPGIFPSISRAKNLSTQLMCPLFSARRLEMRNFFPPFEFTTAAVSKDGLSLNVFLLLFLCCVWAKPPGVKIVDEPPKCLRSVFVWNKVLRSPHFPPFLERCVPSDISRSKPPSYFLFPSSAVCLLTLLKKSPFKPPLFFSCL